MVRKDLCNRRRTETQSRTGRMQRVQVRGNDVFHLKTHLLSESAIEKHIHRVRVKAIDIYELKVFQPFSGGKHITVWLNISTWMSVVPRKRFRITRKS